MDIIFSIYPASKIFLSLDQSKGISITAAQAKKESNTNRVNKIKERIRAYDNADFYDKKITVATSNFEKTIPAIFNVKPEEFRIVDEIATLNAESARLGIGIKIYKQTQEAIEAISETDLAKLLNIEKVEYPALKIANHTNLDRIERLEDILPHLSNEVFAALTAKNINLVEGLEAESKAAAIAKIVKEKDSPFRKLPLLPPVINQIADADVLNFLIEEKVLAVNPGDYNAMDEELSLLHIKYQSMRNKVMQAVKNTVQSINTENQKTYNAGIRTYNEWQNNIAEKRSEILAAAIDLKVLF